MKNSQYFLVVLLLAGLISCNPTVTTSLMKSYEPLDYRDEVIVLGVKTPAPDRSEDLGVIKIGDSGFSTNCGFDVVVERAKLEARKVGGNVVKITEHKLPNIMGSSCHRITARILKVDNLENLKVLESQKEEVNANVDYAVLHVYRNRGVGAMVSYDLYLGDSVICRVKNRFKRSIQIKKDGLNTLWAKTEAKTEIPINVKIGKEYFIRCSVKMGAIVGRPRLELVDNKTGKLEYESFKAKNK